MEQVVCFECGSKNQFELRKSIRHYEGDGYNFTLNVEIPFCTNCGAPIEIESIESEIDKKANEKIRESRGIIKKEEICNILTKYNVSQKFLSKLLGWGEITLTRYISGGYTPNANNSEKLKSLDDPYVFQNLFNEKTKELGEELTKEASFKKLQLSINKNLNVIQDNDGKIYSVINWFLSQVTEETPITHLALQKLLYFSQSWNKVWNQTWLFDNDCEAWIHGAVYRNVYDEFKKFKYMPLPKVDVEVRLDDSEIEVLRFVKKYYFDVYTAKSLENICHLESPYRIARLGYRDNENSKKIMEKENIAAYYLGIAKRFHISRDNPEGIKIYLNHLLA